MGTRSRTGWRISFTCPIPICLIIPCRIKPAAEGQGEGENTPNSLTGETKQKSSPQGCPIKVKEIPDRSSGLRARRSDSSACAFARPLPLRRWLLPTGSVLFQYTLKAKLISVYHHTFTAYTSKVSPRRKMRLARSNILYSHVFFSGRTKAPTNGKRSG